MHISGGYADIMVAFSRREAMILSDVSLRVPFNGSMRYSMGMGGARRGGAIPTMGQTWVWNSNFTCCPKSDHMLWLGNGKGGMRVKVCAHDDRLCATCYLLTRLTVLLFAAERRRPRMGNPDLHDSARNGYSTKLGRRS